MRVAGYREDGAIWLMLDGGLSCILFGDRSSPAVDPAEVEALGPWKDPTGVTGLQRRELAAKLAATRTAPLLSLASEAMRRRKFKFEYETFDEAPKEKEKPAPPPIPDESAAPAEDEPEPEEDDTPDSMPMPPAKKGEKVIGDVPDENPADEIVEKEPKKKGKPEGLTLAEVFAGGGEAGTLVHERHLVAMQAGPVLGTRERDVTQAAQDAYVARHGFSVGDRVMALRRLRSFHQHQARLLNSTTAAWPHMQVARAVADNLVLLLEFDEGNINRDDKGQFASGGGGGGGGGGSEKGGGGGGGGGGESRSAGEVVRDIKGKERELEKAKQDYDSLVNVSANAPGSPDVRGPRDEAASKVRELDRAIRQEKENFAPRHSEGEKKDAAARDRWEQQRKGDSPMSKDKAAMVSYNVDRMNDHDGSKGYDKTEFTKEGSYDGQTDPATGQHIRDGLSEKGWKERPSARGVVMTHPDGKVQARFEAHGKAKERSYFEPAGQKHTPTTKK